MRTIRLLLALVTLLATALLALGVAAPANAAAPSYPSTQKGQRSANAMSVQYLLTARGVPTTADGDFGSVTQTNVKTYQSRNGLTADGVVGPVTWSKLVVSVSTGSTNTNAVKAAQVQLNKYGYGIPVDGKFGSRTATAVASFQAARGLTVDSYVGPVTWQWLVSYSQADDQIACYWAPGTTYAGMKPQQINNVKRIMAAVRAKTTTLSAANAKRAKIISLMVAMTETKLCNIMGSDHDSLGLFQQRPSMGWCSDSYGCSNATYSTYAFLGVSPYQNTSTYGLLDYSTWTTLSNGAAAQKVQKSAYPDRYATWESLATSLVNTYG